MAAITNTYTRFDAKGVREDLSNVIYQISPEETPFMSNIGRENVTNTFFEWQTDDLAAASTTNAQIEGDDITSFTAVTATVRLGNYTQISRKDVIIAGTLEAVDKAGRRSELSYQMAKKSAEIKRDMCSTMLANQAAAAGSTSAARKSGALLAFLKTNTNEGTGGGDPSYTTIPDAARTDATTTNLRSFSEALLKDVIQKVWTEGGNPSIVMAGPVNKQNLSRMGGIASSRFNINGGAKPATIVGAADIYVSDFGNVSIVPNRFQRERDVFVLDPEYASVAYLRPFQTVELAKTGDAEKRMLLCEWGLKIKNEKAHGAVYDLNSTIQTA
jgi:hypothetical protein